MLYSNLKNELEKKLENSYLIVGEDAFLMQDAINQISLKCNVNPFDIDYDLFDSENFTFEKFYASVNQMPFMSEKRLILVKNMTSLTESVKKSILSYTQNPSPFACVIFVDTFNTKLFSFLEKSTALVECSKPSFYECEKFCNKFASEYGKEIDNGAVNLLCELTNYNLASIKNEMTKLCFYVDKTITYEIVEKLVSKTLDYEVYEFTNALAKKNSSRAIEILNDMVARKESNGLIALVSNNFRRMFFSLINDNQEETANLLKVKPYAVTKAKEQAKNFSAKKLKDIYYLLEEIDYKVKSGEMQQINALYYLVFELCK